MDGLTKHQIGQMYNLATDKKDENLYETEAKYDGPFPS